MKTDGMERDKIIFFIFLSFLLHFLVYSFYTTLKRNNKTSPLEIVELLNIENNERQTKDRQALIDKMYDSKEKDNKRTYKKKLKQEQSNAFTFKKSEKEDLENIKNNNSTRRRVVSSETKDPIYAEYVEEWRRRVEIIGNLYYPEKLTSKQISGDLLLDAAIDRNGMVQNISILRSSGSSELDEAAINIVKLAAPFSPLPDQIIAETDILHITRTWKFSNRNE